MALLLLFQTTPLTLDLFSSLPVQLDASSPPPLGFQKSGEMSRNGKAPKLDLSLNLSPPRENQEEIESPRRSTTPTSPPSSCVSSENNAEFSSPETTSMMLVGCPRCLMYVMLSEEDPKCPKCKSSVLLDFMHENKATKKKTRKH